MLLGGDCETNYVSGWQRRNSTELRQTAEVTAGPWTPRFIKRGETCCKNLELLTSFAEVSKKKPFFLGSYSCAADSEIEAPLMEVGVVKKM